MHHASFQGQGPRAIVPKKISVYFPFTCFAKSCVQVEEAHPIPSSHIISFNHLIQQTYLVKVDNWPPKSALRFVEISHTDFTEVTRVVLVEIGSVVMLTTGHTTTTGVFSMLSNTTVTGGHMAAAVKKRGKDELAY
jgi:hypothetical protein